MGRSRSSQSDRAVVDVFARPQGFQSGTIGCTEQKHYNLVHAAFSKPLKEYGWEIVEIRGGVTRWLGARAF